MPPSERWRAFLHCGLRNRLPRAQHDNRLLILSLDKLAIASYNVASER